MVTMATATAVLVVAEDVEVHHSTHQVEAIFPRIHPVQVEVVAVVEEVPLPLRHQVPRPVSLPLPLHAVQGRRRFKIAPSRHCCKATSPR